MIPIKTFDANIVILICLRGTVNFLRGNRYPSDCDGIKDEEGSRHGGDGIKMGI